ncbi:MAG: hypothetical protein EA376_01345 [Phycisphaeraceae bacterium]|nr:MAG: hypothetical protein EA376_01345 [Phycisphaeraceae bacterium]
MNTIRKATRLGAAAGIVICAGGFAALADSEIVAIYTKIPTDPSSIVPGALDENGDPVVENFRALERLFLSPDGSMWIVKGRTQQVSALQNVMIIGSGDTGNWFAQSGQPIPGGAPGEIYNFFGSAIGQFNDNNEFAFTARATGGSNAVFQKVLVYTGGPVPDLSDFDLVAQMGDLYAGLVDNPPENSGDETIGNSIGSIHILNDGTLGAHDPTIQNISALRRPAIFYRAPGENERFEMFHQNAVTTVTGLGGVGIELWKNLSNNAFYTAPDGSVWVAKGQVDQPTSIDGVLVVDGEVVIQEGFPIPGSTVVPGGSFDGITTFDVRSNGNWYARGLITGGAGSWAVHNGIVVAQTGDEIFPGADERWTTFQIFTGNANGDWILLGNTDNPDPARDSVMVLNGEELLVREGDPVTVSGVKGAAFIGRGNLTAGAFTGDSAISDTMAMSTSWPICAARPTEAWT